jgi:hypothetical protein
VVDLRIGHDHITLQHRNSRGQNLHAGSAFIFEPIAD